MKKIIFILASVFLLFVFNASATDEIKTEAELKLLEKKIAIDEKELDFEKEKWEWDKSETKRKEFESQFSPKCDFKRKTPTIEIDIGGYLDTSKMLRTDLTLLRELGHNKVICNIFSGGGNGFMGLAMADVISEFVKGGMYIEGRAYGIVASAAIPVYVSCSKRVSSPNTLFMVHESAIWEFKFGFSKTTHSDVRAQKDMMDKMQERYLSILANNTNKDVTFWKELEGETTWFTTEQAKEWGLVDEIK